MGRAPRVGSIISPRPRSGCSAHIRGGIAWLQLSIVAFVEPRHACRLAALPAALIGRASCDHHRYRVAVSPTG
jgi:hypothetical protein